MGTLSIWHWLIVGALALILFSGKGKISDLMGDVAKGIKSFKKGMAEDDEDKAVPAAEQPRTIDQAPGQQAPTSAPQASATHSPPGKTG